jgi:hypothetical protein
MTVGTVIVRATSKGHLGSRIAAGLAGSGEFNHCMIIDGLCAYEAVPWQGVRSVPHRVAMKGVVRYQDRFAVVPDIDALRLFMQELLDARAGYDWPGAAGLPLRRSAELQDPARWWCWELTPALLNAGGLRLVEPGKLSSATPHTIYNSNLPVSPTVTLKFAA